MSLFKTSQLNITATKGMQAVIYLVLLLLYLRSSFLAVSWDNFSSMLQISKISYNFVGLPKLLSLYKRGCNSVKDIGIFDHWMFLFIVVDNACKYFYCFRYVSNFKSKSIFLNQKHDNLNRYCSDLPKFNGLALDWWAGFPENLWHCAMLFDSSSATLSPRKLKRSSVLPQRLLLPSALSRDIYLIDKSI